mmetsp:Transcript_4207/g.8040  ORF Transcript_4207/g.8040 Transcript_4207/m.8040 type:complete len:270 (-) Transcript_4207:1028-1837(-)
MIPPVEVPAMRSNISAISAPPQASEITCSMLMAATPRMPPPSSANTRTTSPPAPSASAGGLPSATSTAMAACRSSGSLEQADVVAVAWPDAHGEAVPRSDDSAPPLTLLSVEGASRPIADRGLDKEAANPSAAPEALAADVRTTPAAERTVVPRTGPPMESAAAPTTEPATFAAVHAAIPEAFTAAPPTLFPAPASPLRVADSTRRETQPRDRELGAFVWSTVGEGGLVQSEVGGGKGDAPPTALQCSRARHLASTTSPVDGPAALSRM